MVTAPEKRLAHGIDLDAVEQAIRAAEQRTSGGIRVAIARSWFWGDARAVRRARVPPAGHDRDARPERRAHLRRAAPAQGGGDRRRRGSTRRSRPTSGRALVYEMTADFRRGNQPTGLVAAVELLGGALAAAFPIGPGDVNELTNTVTGSNSGPDRRFRAGIGGNIPLPPRRRRHGARTTGPEHLSEAEAGVGDHRRRDQLDGGPAQELRAAAGGDWRDRRASSAPASSASRSRSWASTGCRSEAALREQSSAWAFHVAGVFILWFIVDEQAPKFGGQKNSSTGAEGRGLLVHPRLGRRRACGSCRRSARWPVARGAVRDLPAVPGVAATDEEPAGQGRDLHEWSSSRAQSGSPWWPGLISGAIVGGG